MDKIPLVGPYLQEVWPSCPRVCSLIFTVNPRNSPCSESQAEKEVPGQLHTAWPAPGHVPPLQCSRAVCLSTASWLQPFHIRRMFQLHRSRHLDQQPMPTSHRGPKLLASCNTAPYSPWCLPLHSQFQHWPSPSPWRVMGGEGPASQHLCLPDIRPPS